jgi:hypothetical protein
MKSAISLHHQKKKTDCFCKAAAYKTIMINQMRSIEAKNYKRVLGGGGGEEGTHERNASKCTKKCARNIYYLIMQGML